MIRDCCRYPVAFGEDGQLIGVAAAKDVGLNEAFVYVPTRLIINESKFKADPQVGHILEQHSDFFDDRDNSEHMKVTFYVMHELTKGADSFWHWYFEVSDLPDMLAFWSEEELS